VNPALTSLRRRSLKITRLVPLNSCFNLKVYDVNIKLYLMWLGLSRPKVRLTSKHNYRRTSLEKVWLRFNSNSLF